MCHPCGIGGISTAGIVEKHAGQRDLCSLDSEHHLRGSRKNTPTFRLVLGS